MIGVGNEHELVGEVEHLILSGYSYEKVVKDYEIDTYQPDAINETDTVIKFNDKNFIFKKE